jgi:cytoskeletal protein CcmA (bactofilin family)
LGVTSFFKKAPFTKAEFLLPKTTVVCGPFIADGDGEIDGRLKGDITVGGKLVIGKHAEIRGNINAAALEVHGFVQGNVFCTGKVIINSAAVIKGDVHAAVFDIKEGALIEGLIKKEKSSPLAVDALHGTVTTGDAPALETTLPSTNMQAAEVTPEPVKEPVPQRPGDMDGEVTSWF